MTPNGTAIQALRQVRSLSLRDLARLAQTSASQLSRIERGLAGASEDLIYRLAAVLDVPVDDITRGAPMSTQEAVAPERGAENELAPTIPGQADATVKVRPKKPLVEREVPYPGTAEGEVFHYTPEEAARFLPWSALQLKRKSYAREIPFNGGGGRITFTGLDIREISLMTAVRPLSEAEPVQQRSA